MSIYIVRREQLQKNMQAVSAVIMGQCSDAMKAKLKAHPEFKEWHTKANCVWLLTTIWATMLKFEGYQYIFLGLQVALTAICNHRQGDNNLFLQSQVGNLVKAYELYGGKFGRSDALMDKIKELEDKTGLTTTEKSTKAHDRAVALKFLQGADRGAYGTSWVSLQNNFLLNLKLYPRDLTEAYMMLLNYVPPHNPDQQKNSKNTPNNMTNAATGPNLHCWIRDIPSDRSQFSTNRCCCHWNGRRPSCAHHAF